MLVKEGITQFFLTFNRTVRPVSAVKAPSLIGFFDGSSVAMAGVVYIRWMCFKNKDRIIEGPLNKGCSLDTDYNPEIHIFKSALITSKAKVAPMDGLTIPRSELISLQLLTRLLAKTIKALPKVPSDVHILGDSTCVISAMDKVATSFNPFMHSRLADIHHTLDSIRKQAEVMPIQYIPSKKNIADIATWSETSLSMLGPDSLWHTSPN